VRWTLERPILTAAAAAVFLAWGTISLKDVSTALLPEIAPGRTTIETDAPGMVAAQVETLVTRPLEAGLLGAAGIKEVRSTSVEGLSTIVARLDPGTNPERARTAVAERVAATVAALPAGVGAPRIAPLEPAEGDVLKIGFLSKKLDPMALRDLVQWTVRPRLLAAPGVARISMWGGAVRRIEVRARPADLSDSDLGFLDVLKAVQRSTGVAGAGFIDTEAQRVLIDPRGQTLTPEDVGAGQIPTLSGPPVRIDDVADVVEAAAPAYGDAVIMGRPGVLMAVGRQVGADGAKTTAGVLAALADLKPALDAAGVETRADLEEPAAAANGAVKTVLIDLLIGAFLAGAALIVFFRDLRAAGVSLAAAGLTLLASALVLKAMGWTLNVMTLGGLAVALGVVIDDAVVDVENVVARLREAETRHANRSEAILAASLEIRAPVAYAALLMSLAMAPILGLGGPQGRLLTPLAVAVIVASLASLLVAATVTPALCRLFLRHIGPDSEPKLIGRIKDAQGSVITRLARRPRLVFLVAVLLAAAPLILALRVPSALLPAVRDGHILIEMNQPTASALAVSRDFGVKIAPALLAQPGVRAVAQRIGRDPTGEDSWGTERNAFDLDLEPGLSSGAQDRIAAGSLDLLRRAQGLKPRIVSRAQAYGALDGPGGEVRAIVFGPDLDALDDAGARIAAVMQRLDGAAGARFQREDRAPVVRVDINFQRLALFGLSAADVLDTIQAAFAGERVAQVFLGGRTMDLAVSAQTSLREDPETVARLLLRSTSGITVPLSRVANVYLTDDRALIAHENGLRRVVAVAAPRDPSRYAARLKSALANVKLPRGLSSRFAPRTLRRLRPKSASSSITPWPPLACWRCSASPLTDAPPPSSSSRRSSLSRAPPSSQPSSGRVSPSASSSGSSPFTVSRCVRPSSCLSDLKSSLSQGGLRSPWRPCAAPRATGSRRWRSPAFSSPSHSRPSPSTRAQQDAKSSDPWRSPCLAAW
jgi:Cu/Ag efflux pump CusA